MQDTALRIPCGDIELEGTLLSPDGGGPFAAVVVCHPHPQYGGNMFNNVVSAAVAGLVDRGIAAVRFNFRGVGDSGGEHGEGEDEQDDVRAALAHASALPEVDGARLGLAGYSFGSAVAAATLDGLAPAPPALALIALPLRSESAGAPAFAGYANPLLLLAGDRDEVCPDEGLRDLAASLGDRAEVHIVAGADHFWGGHERAVTDAVGEFFAAHLQGEPVGDTRRANL